LGAFAFVGALGLLRWPTRRDWPIILSNGILQLALFFALGNLALRYIPAGRSAVLAYTTTLWLVPLEALAGGSRLDLWRGLGLVAGLSGVAVLLNPLALDWSRRRTGAGRHRFDSLAWRILDATSRDWRGARPPRHRHRRARD